MKRTTAESDSAKPVEYISTGTHASFPRRRFSLGLRGQRHRSVGVQSTAQLDQTRSPQTRLALYCSVPLTVKHGESDVGGLPQNHGSNTASGRPDVARNSQSSCHCVRFYPVATEYY